MVDWFYLQKSINASTLSPEKLQNKIDRLIFLESQSNEFAVEEIKIVTEEIKNSIEDPIIMARNYNQTDIIRHLRKLK